MTVSTITAGESASGNKHDLSLLKGCPIRFQFGLDRPKHSAPLPGFELSQKQVVTIHVGGRFPELLRGRKWAEYPIVSPPVFTPEKKYLGFIWPGTLIDLSPGELKDALSDQPFFLYDETCMPKGATAKWRVAYRLFAAHLHDELCPHKPIRARFAGQAQYEDIEVSSLVAVSAGWHHFHHNYKVNFAAIGLNAVDYVIERFDAMPRQQVESSMTYARRLKVENTRNVQLAYEKYHHSFMTEPWGLQVLFALRNSTPEERSTLHAYFKQPFPPPRKGAVPMTFGKHVRDGEWIGTGKYEGRLNLRDEIGWVIHDASALGLVDMETGGEVALTPAGEAFLDIMHTDNYDPDAFMRFIDPVTLSMPEAEIARIDAWMTRFFRKMKVKVDKLRAK